MSRGPWLEAAGQEVGRPFDGGKQQEEAPTNCMSTYPGRNVASRKREVPKVSRLLGRGDDQSMPIEEGGCEVIACKKRHGQ